MKKRKYEHPTSTVTAVDMLCPVMVSGTLVRKKFDGRVNVTIGGATTSMEIERGGDATGEIEIDSKQTWGNIWADDEEDQD